jgi:hypothetical protein
MTWSSRSIIRMIGLLASVACTTCSNETVMIKLTGDSECSESLLEDIRSTLVELRTPASQRSECITLRVNTIGDLQAELAKRINFEDVEEGQRSVSVFAYKGYTCDGDDVILCGQTTFELPTDGQAVTVEVQCYSGSSPPDAFKECAGL